MRRSCPQGPFGIFAARKARESYHHGNLKETLLDAAEALIAERGPANLALSEMARMAGVSSAAIYRHYADLNALIGAVAERGFVDFALRLEAAARLAGKGPRALDGMGRAYLAFARERPGAYAAMFSSTVAFSSPELAAAGERAFAGLTAGVNELGGAMGIDPAGCHSLALKIWSLSHGIATLAGSGRLGPATGADPERLLKEGADALIMAAQRR